MAVAIATKGYFIPYSARDGNLGSSVATLGRFLPRLISEVTSGGERIVYVDREVEVPVPGGIGGAAVHPDRQKPVVTVRLNTKRRIPTQVFVTSVREKNKEEE